MRVRGPRSPAIIMNYFSFNCTLHFRQQWILVICLCVMRAAPAPPELHLKSDSNNGEWMIGNAVALRVFHAAMC